MRGAWPICPSGLGIRTGLSHNPVEQTMKAFAEDIPARGKYGNRCLQRRIPAAVRAAFPADQTRIG